MDTESPAQRLTRRIGADRSAESDEPGAEPDTALARWLPEGRGRSPSDLFGTLRADPGRAGVLALAVVGVLAVLVTVFTVMRDRTPAVSSANLPPVQMVSATSTAPPAPVSDVVVSVVGLVNKPGLVTVAAGARIADALDAAGGVVAGADVVGLNMARRVQDGEQIIVGIAGTPGAPAPMASSVSGGVPVAQAPAGAGPGATVDLNTATAAELDALPGVGPVTAAAIIAWRDANGGFTAVDQLGEVDGIGPARLDKLRELVHV